MALFVFGLQVVGCARYEFDIARPTELAAHVDSKADHTFTREPLEYRLRAADNRLVVRIFNNSDDAMELVGEHSSVVDPNGQSHPLRSAPIAAHSFTKLILPPLRPRLERGGPSFGIGVGTVIGDRRARYRDGNSLDGWDEEPRYFTVIDDDTYYWNWDGESEIRVSLSFLRKDETFTHEFVVRRVKM